MLLIRRLSEAWRRVLGALVVSLALAPARPARARRRRRARRAAGATGRRAAALAGPCIGMSGAGGRWRYYVVGRALADKVCFRATLSALWLALNAVLVAATRRRRDQPGEPSGSPRRSPRARARLATGSGSIGYVPEQAFRVGVTRCCSPSARRCSQGADDGRALVTGATGSRGARWWRRARAEGHAVRGPRAQGERGGREGEARGSGATRRGRPADQRALEGAARAGGGVPRARLDDATRLRAEHEAVNLVGTENLLAACRAAGVRRVVYRSTADVTLGDVERSFVDEDFAQPVPFDDPSVVIRSLAEDPSSPPATAAFRDGGVRPGWLWAPTTPASPPRSSRAARRGPCGAGSTAGDRSAPPPTRATSRPPPRRRGRPRPPRRCSPSPTTSA